MNKITYEMIKDSVVYSFEEYVGDDGFTASQASAKVFEEDWRKLNYSNFTKTAYYICVSIECFALREIPDFIYDRLNVFIKNNIFEDTTKKEDIEHILQDMEKCKQLMEKNDYKIIETSFDTKSRIEYILSLKP